MKSPMVNELIFDLGNCIGLEDGKVTILDPLVLQKNIHKLAEYSALESGAKQGWARYLSRLIAISCGIYPASIQDLYLGIGRGEIPPIFTVPAMNLRALSYDSARAVFQAAAKIEAGAFIFEIARSEMGYTDQRPAEYATSIFVAAIKEGYSGPIFIQGDHFQVSLKKYKTDPDKEINTLKELITEAIKAGFYNIDIDTSTLVDLEKTSLPEQQYLNTNLSAMFADYIRKNEPTGITISIGGEIGEVGGHNSTEEELRAYMDGFNDYLKKYSADHKGLSKISIQTGTSHGGVVLPDGSIAQVSVDFDILLHLSRVARNSYGLAGAVQHGASTLPEDAFGKFVESEACEVHLATNFQNMLFDRIPDDLRREMYNYLDENYASDRKSGMTDEQFYYKTRKNAIGPFKAALWKLSTENKERIVLDWEQQFSKLFNYFNIANTKKYVEKTINPVLIEPNINIYLDDTAVGEDISDLAD